MISNLDILGIVFCIVIFKLEILYEFGQYCENTQKISETISIQMEIEDIKDIMDTLIDVH